MGNDAAEREAREIVLSYEVADEWPFVHDRIAEPIAKLIAERNALKEELTRTRRCAQAIADWDEARRRGDADATRAAEAAMVSSLYGLIE